MTRKPDMLDRIIAVDDAADAVAAAERGREAAKRWAVPATCAECGHLHFLGRELGYCECPIEDCGCAGQAWAHELDVQPGLM